MDKKIQILIFMFLFFIFLFTILNFLLEKKNSNYNKIEFERISENIIRSSTEWEKDVKKELFLILKKDYNLIQEDFKKLKLELLAIGETKAFLGGNFKKDEKSDDSELNNNNSNIEICKDSNKLIDIHGYTKKIQSKKIKDINNALLANVRFNALKSKPWEYKVFERKYNLITILSKNNNDQLVFHHSLKYFIPEEKNNKFYNINIDSSIYKQEEKLNNFFWFNPKIDINFLIGINLFNFVNIDDKLPIIFDIGFSFSSYGINKLDSIFKMFRFGIGYDINNNFMCASFAPILFNFGKFLPLINNLYISPQVSLNEKNNFLLSIGIGPEF